MKIQFKISSYQLAFINEMLAVALNSDVKGSMQKRAAHYIINQVAEKFLKKAIEKRAISKPFKMALKYYEAYHIHQFLLVYIDIDSTEESRRVTREVLAEINPKII